MYSRPYCLPQTPTSEEHRSCDHHYNPFADDKTEEWRLIFKITHLKNRERKIPSRRTSSRVSGSPPCCVASLKRWETNHTGGDQGFV